jgi:hypothetical protein
MTTYFAGNEDINFVRSGGGPYMSTAAGRFDSDYARAALHCHKLRIFRAEWDSTVNSFWYQGRYQWDAGNNSQNDDALWTLYNDSQQILRIRHKDAIDSDLQFERWDGSWTLIEDSGIQPGDDVTHRIAFNVTLSTATGVFEMYLDDALIIDQQNIDTLGTSGVTDANACELESPYHNGSAPTSTQLFVSEILVLNVDPRTKRLMSLNPDGDGNGTAWTGVYTDIDEIEENESDLIASTAANQIEQQTVGATPASAANFSVDELRVSARARRGASGPQNIQLSQRHNSVDGFSGTKILGTAYAVVSNSFLTNPDTAAAWTISELATAEIGVKSIT